VHAFGAYFGLATSFMLWVGKAADKRPIGHPKLGSNYQSDTFAMVGSLFLWLLWPSYNGALAVDSAQDRAVINTAVCIAASCIMTFCLSYAVRGKLLMVDIQNATLAGGVASGCIADIMTKPWGCMLLGIVSGTTCVLGYIFMSPFLESTIGLHDGAGIHNLHAIPGIIAGLSAVFTNLAYQSQIWNGFHVGFVIPARSPTNLTLALSYGLTDSGQGRSANSQAAYQLAGLGVSVFLGLLGGLCTGAIVRLPFFDPPRSEQLFNDMEWWAHPPQKQEEEPEPPADQGRRSRFLADDE